MPGLKGGLKTCRMQTLLSCTAAHLDFWASKQYISHHVCTAERKLIDAVCTLRDTLGALTKQPQNNQKQSAATAPCCLCAAKDSCAKFSIAVPPVGRKIHYNNRDQDCDQQSAFPVCALCCNNKKSDTNEMNKCSVTGTNSVTTLTFLWIVYLAHPVHRDILLTFVPRP